VTDVKSDRRVEATVAPADALDAVDEQLVEQLAERARSEGLQLTGEGGLLARLTKRVVESALEGEMDDHLGYGKHDPVGRNGGNSRNGTRGKTVLTEAGPVELAVPRDRNSSFEPRLVKKRQRRLSGVDDLVISLSAKGSPTARSPRTWPRCTARRCPSRPSPRSPTGCWRAWPNGRTGRWMRLEFYRWLRTFLKECSDASIRAQQDAGLGEMAVLRADPRWP
jgi:hypothetical protein